MTSSRVENHQILLVFIVHDNNKDFTFKKVFSIYLIPNLLVSEDTCYVYMENVYILEAGVDISIWLRHIIDRDTHSNYIYA